MATAKVKISGERSIQSKLSRLAYELEFDAMRIRGDHGTKHEYLANGVAAIASQLGKMSRAIDE